MIETVVFKVVLVGAVVSAAFLLNSWFELWYDVNCRIGMTFPPLYAAQKRTINIGLLASVLFLSFAIFLKA